MVNRLARRGRILIVAAVLAISAHGALVVAGGSVDGVWVDEGSVSRGLSQALAARGITTQSGFNAAVDALTDAQVAQVVRHILKRSVRINAP